MIVQAGENPVCGAEAHAWQRTKQASSTHLAEGVFGWRQSKPAENFRRSASENGALRIAQLYKARKGEPVSPFGDVTEMRTLIIDRVSGHFLVLPAEIVRFACGDCAATHGNYARAGA